MAYELVRTKSIKATSDLSTYQFCFVKLDVNGQIVACGAGGNAIGVLQDKPKAGDPGAVCNVGDETKVLCGGNFAAGSLVSSDPNGKAVVATSGLAYLGQALTAGATGFVCTILFQPQGQITP